MAAAVSSRSRGAAGGLLFLFTLLGLVCTAASLMDENILKNIKENLQDAEQDLDTAKAHMETASETINGCMSRLDSGTMFMRKSAEGSPERPKSIEDFREEAKSLRRDNEEMNAEIFKREQELRDLKKIVQAQEEQHAEL